MSNIPGHFVSKETREKIRKALTGRHFPKLSLSLKEAYKRGNTKMGFKKGYTPWNKGKPMSEKHRTRIIENCGTRGSKHWDWKGGISSDKNYISWLCNKRNRMKRLAPGSHTFQEWNDLKAKHNYICLICHKKEPEIKLTEDHIIPISKGGSDYIENMQPLCQSCNSKKYNKISANV